MIKFMYFIRTNMYFYMKNKNIYPKIKIKLTIS